MKKLLILSLALIILLLAGCSKKPAEETIPGVEDSIFDQAGNVEIQRPEDTKPEAEQDGNPTQSTKPDASKPTIPDGPKNPGEMTDPTHPDEPESPTKPGPQPATPDTTPSTTPEETEPTEETLPTVDYTKLDYMGFHALSAKEQEAVLKSFDSIEEFFVWYNDLQATYEKENPPIEVDGTVDLDKVLGGKK